MTELNNLLFIAKTVGKSKKLVQFNYPINRPANQDRIFKTSKTW